MPEDLLLEWASERGEGSWELFRRAHEWAFAGAASGGWRPGPGFTMRMLATLGHLEVDWEDSRWTAGPPVLTLLPSAGAHALLTGGRTRALLDRLKEEVGDDPCLYLLDPYKQPLAPAALLLACEDEGRIEALAERLGIDYEYSISERLSRVLPPIDAYLRIGASTPAARGYGVDRFDPQSLKWEPVEDDRRPALYGYEALVGREYRLVTSEREIYDVDKALGIWAALSRWGENRLRYRPEEVNGNLIVRLDTPLPTLQARTAALCSGLAPKRYGETLWYRNVPQSYAERIAQSLDQTIQIIA